MTNAYCSRQVIVGRTTGVDRLRIDKFMLNLFTIPAATTTIAAITEYSSPWFTELLPVAYVAIGVVVGVGFVMFLIAIITGAFSRLFHRKEDHNPDYIDKF